jgi:putative transposase
VSSLLDEVDEHGRRLVVRNGHAEPRSLVTGAGPLLVHAPRVNNRRVDEATGERMRFRSSILPPWARKSPRVAEVLPLMYLHGMSSGDFAPALEEFFGSAAGLSASVITRLTTDWQRERDQFAHRSIKEVDYVYLFADGIHFNVRLQEARLCVLVIVGVRADRTKEFELRGSSRGGPWAAQMRSNLLKESVPEYSELIEAESIPDCRLGGRTSQKFRSGLCRWQDCINS